jgi:hypothetical protein
MEYIGVYLVDLPTAIRGFTVRNADDSYSIIINAGMSDVMQRDTYDHEIEHINNHDFDSIYDIGYLESIRHAV